MIAQILVAKIFTIGARLDELPIRQFLRLPAADGSRVIVAAVIRENLSSQTRPLPCAGEDRIAWVR